MTLLERDQKVIWHPYTQHGLEEVPLPVKGAKGAWITLENGDQLLDAISSWWVNIHGHGNPKIAEAISRQSEILEHVLFAGFTHEPAVELAELLVLAMKERKTNLEKVFYSDNGSTAVEVALKMAYQYHVNISKKPRTRFLALHGAYHGDTFGAMAVGEPEGFHSVFRTLLPPVDFVRPGDIDGFSELLEKNPNDYAAFIFEPMVQGAGGMVMYDGPFLRDAQELCRKHNVLLICDEVFTGFYRTGRAFAFEHAKITPDFICLSKGITGGYLPLAATLTTKDIFDAFVSQDVSKAFLHGHSYTANPLACAAAVSSWNLLHTKETQDNIKKITSHTELAISKFKTNSHVRDPRALGTIGAVTMNFDFNYMSKVGRWFKTKAIEKGVLLRPLGHVLYAVPPFCVTQEEIEKIYSTIDELINEFEKGT